MAGIFVLIGLMTRFAALVLTIIMAVAIFTTKIPILLGHGFWGFSLRELSSYGFWSMAHAFRTDFAMLLSSVFILIVRPGRLAVDYRFAANADGEQSYFRIFEQVNY